MLGKKQIWAPVHATSRATAIRKLPAVVAAMQSEIDAARAETKAGCLQASPPRRGRPLSPRQLAVAHYDGQVAFDTELRNSDDRFSRGFVDMDYVTALRSVVTGAASNQDMLDTIGGFVNKYERSGNFNAEFGTPAWREAVRALAVAELESLARTAERDDGDFDGAPKHPLLTEKPQPIVATDPLADRILGPDSTKPLSEIVHDFIKERKPSDRSAENYKITVQLFAEILEEDMPVYRIMRAEVLKFKRALQELPSNRTKRFPGLTAPQVIKANQARATPFQPLDAKTINNNYLGGLRSLFNWCFENEVIRDNPADHVKVDVGGTGTPRRINFAPSDLTKLFSAERYDTSKVLDERQWAELISLFGGMRASELAQIKLDSVRHERDILVFAIEEKTKNVGSLRLIPVHSALLGLGLEKHIKKLRASGATHLFPNWYQKGEAKRDWSAFIPDAFNVTTKKHLAISDRRKTWHSFRHTFKTGLARAGVPRSMQDDLCGHSDSSAGAGYVHGESVEAMKEAVEKLRFDGFALGA
jgi:integrase